MNSRATILKGGDRAKVLLQDLFERAFKHFLKAERENIQNNVSERNLCGRLALLLEDERKGSGLNGYYADTEYNRNLGRKIKTILDENMEEIVINCDLILHSRGQIAARDNLIAVEMKKAASPEEEKETDRKRLRALTKSTYDDTWSYDGKTLPEHVCGYLLGFLVELDTRRSTFKVEQFAEGNLIRSFSGSF